MVSVEDSMSMVHLSRGSLNPPSDQVRSEVAIVCQLARTLLGPDHPVPWEQFAGDYDKHPRRDRRRGARLRRLQPQGPRSPTDSSCRTVPAIRANSPPAQARPTSRLNPLEWVPVPRGSAGAADAAQPRPVQHHHLRARRPLPRRQGRPPGGVRQPRRHRTRSACPTATGSTWSRSSPTATGTAGAPRQGLHGGRPTRHRSATPRPTTRRPIPLCRWITPPRGRIRRCRRRSSSDWSAPSGYG